MKRFSAWIGWPGAGVPPGHNWVPGPVLRAAILLLVYGFLALALTVNYAASVAFFLLAMLGMYVGLRRGFVNGLTKAEKLVMIAFAAYPMVAIASYLVGTRTNVGFRFLGRDLRFLLFIPAYLAIRWSRPRATHLGWAFLGGAVGASILALLQNQPWPAPLPHGVAGTHITFGNLALLSGFLAGGALVGRVSDLGRRKREAGWAIKPFLAAAAGIAASVLSKARGGWLAIPLLAASLASTMARLAGASARWRLLIVVLCVGGSVGAPWLLPTVRHRVLRVARNAKAYWITANVQSITAPCVDRKRFLAALLRKSHVVGPGRVNIVQLGRGDKGTIASYRCTGDYAFSFVNPAGTKSELEVSLFRGYGPAKRNPQTVEVLAKGTGRLTVWWRGPWVRIHTGHWRIYSARQSYKRIGSTNLRVEPGQRLLVVPLQRPFGVYAYALAESSLGQRLQMWKAAWHMFSGHPWLGVGTGAFQAQLPSAVVSPLLMPITGDHEHAHSDYLNGLATKGLLGLVALLAILLVPAGAIAWTRRAQMGFQYDLTGAMLALGFGVFGVTETMFVHSLVNSWYVVVTAAVVATSMRRAIHCGVSSP